MPQRCVVRTRFIAGQPRIAVVELACIGYANRTGKHAEKLGEKAQEKEKLRVRMDRENSTTPLIRSLCHCAALILTHIGTSSGGR